jgi:TalC/MipB family fructose-6-phosphate aldolase
MELYLDSVDFAEVRKAAQLGILTGLTTTPTFMHRHGITDIDGAIVELSKLVRLLHIEALGDTPADVLAEAERLSALPIDGACELVFKIPINLVGVEAARQLSDRGLKTNVHLIYTLNQAYLACLAGATYVCPLVGRLHDQGQDAMALVEDIVEMVETYGFATKVMVSSVRHAEHVRQAIRIGAHTVTVPWGVLSRLTDNSLTAVGTQQFVEHTRMMTERVESLLNGQNPTVQEKHPVSDALVSMSESNLGAVSVLDDKGNLVGIFTDGDLRRGLKDHGSAFLQQSLSSLSLKAPITLNASALLYQAVALFKEKQVDNLLITRDNQPIGILDIQDLVRQGLVG